MNKERSQSQALAEKPAGDERQYVGQTLDDRYELVSFLGKGGMGAVFFARHVLIGKPVAVKILERQRESDPKLMTRLFREAQMAASIRHPNIVDVIDVGVAPSGDPYLVMEYLEGEDLASLLGRVGAISVAAACAILEPVLLALQAAHNRSVVHRDLKPANIFLSRQENAPPVVKLIDFGVPKYRGPMEARITATGALLGTACYMAPEQAMGKEDVDARADVYAIGATLYEMLTGRVPFKGSNYNHTIVKIVSDPPPPPESPKEHLDEATVALIERVLEKSPEKRFQSASELLDNLRALDAFRHRTEAFAELARSLQVKALGGGGPASATHPAPISPADAVARRVRTPLRDEEKTVVDRPVLSRLLKIGSGPALAVILLLGLVVLLLNGGRAPAPATHSAPSPKAIGAHRRVKIKVQGAPAGAKVFYKETYVATNPFSVRASNRPAKVRVELSGYEPFVVKVIPSANKILSVHMKKLAAKSGAESKGKAESAPNQPRPSATALKRPKAPPKPQSGEIRRSGRDTFYSEKFE